jgi:hypothetical protein
LARFEKWMQEEADRLILKFKAKNSKIKEVK